MTSNSKRVLACQILLGGALLLASQSQVFQLLIQIPIDAVALGASPAKTLLFLGYLFLVSFLWYKPPQQAGTRPHLIFLLSVLLLHGIGMAEYAWLCYRFDLGIDFVLFVSNSEISATRLVHTHNAKMIFGALYPTGSYGHDPGLAFAAYYPMGWIRCHALLFLASFTSLMVSLYSMRKQVSAGVYGVFVVAAFMALKTSIDAGLLNHEALVSLPVTAWIVLKACGWDRPWTPYALAGLSAALFAGVMVVYPVHLDSAFRFAANILVLLLAYSLASGHRVQSATLLIVLFLLPALRPFFISGAWRFPSSGFNTLAYSLREIGAGQRLTLIAPGQIGFPVQGMEVEEALKLGGYTYAQILTTRPMSLLDITQDLALPVHHRPILIHGQDGHKDTRTGASMTAILTGDSRSKLEDTARLAWLIERMDISYLGQSTYQLDFTLKGCVNDNVVAAMFDELGVSPMIIKKYQSFIRP